MGDLAGGGFYSLANGVSGDGSVVVGSSFSASEAAAFIWDATNGMRSLQSVLTGLGLDLTGWRLASATAVSADGLTTVGYGVNPSGFMEGWVADLHPAAVPERATALLLASGVAGLALAVRRGKK